METEQKILKLESLNPEEFLDLMKSVLERIGYSDVKYHDKNSITGLFRSALSSHIHYFFIEDSQLSGTDINLKYFGERINSAQVVKFSSSYIVSKFYISEGFKSKLQQSISTMQLNFIGRDEIIELIDKNNPGYWRHKDTILLDYEKAYNEEIFKDSQLKKLPVFNSKYDKVLDIFIEPRIYHLSQEVETNTPHKKKVTLQQILDNKKPALLTGDPGTGKSTTLRKIGEQLVQKNNDDQIKSLPVFFSVVEIFDANYDINKLLSEKLLKFFKSLDDSFFNIYQVTILIDSIDELDEQNQKNVVDQLKTLYNEKHVRFIVGTRNDDKLQINTELAEYNSYKIERFNSDQIKRFIQSFFPSNESKADKLLEALKDNRVLEKLPLTPLTLSLISILFEENNLEIPATITDIFDNFNSLLIGRATVSTKIEFIDISFKERILSLYAFQILKRPEHAPMSREEFLTFFREYFNQKTIPLKKGSLDEALDYLINNTGILVLKNGKYVKFSHDSFMEYYAAIEVFKHQRDQESAYVENFFENNWQNSAIFYAGKSKDMPHFLKLVLGKIKTANKLNDLLSAVMGTGYLLQALYQTDNVQRKDVVTEAIDLNIKVHEIYSKLFGDEKLALKNYKMPILWLMNLVYFYESFNSVTLKEPLNLSFKEIVLEYKQDKRTYSGFKALQLALTLDSRRINDYSALTSLVFETNLSNDPILCLLTDFSLEVLKGVKYDVFKKELRSGIKKLNAPLRVLTSQTVSKLRFSQLDPIRLDRQIKLITEGKTDAELLEHAFMVLTDGELPYWEISPVGKEEGGGANKLRLALQDAITFHDAKEHTVIGLFDHDMSGVQGFDGLKFTIKETRTVKEYEGHRIFAVCLPVPGQFSHYIQKDDNLNFFEIEHYFDVDILKENEMLETTPIPNIYKIKEKGKSKFVKAMKKINDPKVFHNFKTLFEIIDSINGIDIKYNF